MSGFTDTQQAFLMFFAFVMTPIASWAALGAPTDHTALAQLLAGIIGGTSSGGILAFIKEFGGTSNGSNDSTSTTNPPAPTIKTSMTRLSAKFKVFWTSFVRENRAILGHRADFTVDPDKTGLLDPDPKPRRHRGWGKYDPDPRPKRHRLHKGHRKGVEPAGLKRWRLGHIHRPHRRPTADPGYKRSFWKGPRGGHYFQGPHKRRYDPAPRRPSKGGIEKAFNGWLGSIVGLFAALGWGVWQGYSEYEKASPGNGWTNYGNAVKTEYQHLYDFNSKDTYYLPNYLAYKFLGRDPTTGNFGMQSAWVTPFWTFTIVGIFTAILNRIHGHGISKIHRITKPITKICKYGAIGSAAGALFLPGCGTTGPQSKPQTQTPALTQNPQQYRFQG
jgi:hypothetical protein